MWLLFLRIFAAAVEWFTRQQLISAGEDKEKNRVHEANDKTRKKAKEVKREVDSLPSDIVKQRLSKYTRKDK
jgi:preprotein translocase subunit Sec63